MGGTVRARTAVENKCHVVAEIVVTDEAPETRNSPISVEYYCSCVSQSKSIHT